jgi:phosphopantothenoylcysteine decarboxylase/phosphopantothenate--cysteine ligase
MTGPRILLVVGGGIAAYKACELVRLIRKGGGEVTCVLTEGGAKFVTPMALAALSENQVHTTLWDLTNEVEMGHIQLSRQSDLLVVCPATADLLAKMAAGIADDLATTLLLATDKPVLAVPAMNVRMWQHSSTVRNVEALRAAGVAVMQPDEGAMACGEFGPGRLPEPVAVWLQIAGQLGVDPGEMDLPIYVALAAPEEGLEESEEVEAEGLGGLSASLIIRSPKKAKTLEDETLVDEEALLEDLPPVEEEPPPPLNLEAPILSKKGRAKAAPPTDPEAINHLVKDDPDAAPEPFAEELPDPLEGQPDFDPGDTPHPPEAQPVDDRLAGKHVLVTAGPTHEAIDPVRFIANRSSGKQGFAIAAAAAAAGARVTLVSGPVMLPTPPGVSRIDVVTAQQMADAVKKALPCDVAVMVAAVADWRVSKVADEKIKKRGSAPPSLQLTENPDILATVAGGKQRPKLLIGFAAETEDVIEHAKEKRKRKGADWIIANDVSGPGDKSVMGGDTNVVHIVTAKAVESLPEMPKDDVARALVEKMIDAL